MLGPSGSGKSTLMRSIVGAQRIAQGSLTVLGLPAGAPALRHLLAYMRSGPARLDANVTWT